MKGLVNKIFVLFLTLGLTVTLIPADIVRAEPADTGVYELKVDESKLTYLEPGKAEPWIDGKSIPSTLNDLEPGEKPKEPVEYDPVRAAEAEEWMRLHGVEGDLRGNPQEIDLDSLIDERYGAPIYVETYWDTEIGTTVTSCSYARDDTDMVQDFAEPVKDSENGGQDSAITEISGLQTEAATSSSGSGGILTKYASVTYKCTAISAVGVKNGDYSVTLKVNANGEII